MGETVLPLGPPPERWEQQIYERAQENAHHSDAVLYEVTAIVWSASVLLLGFVLEVPPERDRQRLVVVASVLAILLSLYVPFVMWLVKIGQHRALEICREIETELPEKLRLHTQIHEIYPKMRGQLAVWFLTICFIIAWLYILHRALICVFQPSCCS